MTTSDGDGAIPTRAPSRSRRSTAPVFTPGPMSSSTRMAAGHDPGLGDEHRPRPADETWAGRVVQRRRLQAGSPSSTAPRGRSHGRSDLPAWPNSIGVVTLAVELSDELARRRRSTRSRSRSVRSTTRRCTAFRPACRRSRACGRLRRRRLHRSAAERGQGHRQRPDHHADHRRRRCAVAARRGERGGQRGRDQRPAAVGQGRGGQSGPSTCSSTRPPPESAAPARSRSPPAMANCPTPTRSSLLSRMSASRPPARMRRRARHEDVPLVVADHFPFTDDEGHPLVAVALPPPDGGKLLHSSGI